MSAPKRWFAAKLEFRPPPVDENPAVIVRTRLIRAADREAAYAQATVFGERVVRGELEDPKLLGWVFVGVRQVVELGGPELVEASLEGMHAHLRAELSQNPLPQGSHEG